MFSICEMMRGQAFLPGGQCLKKSIRILTRSGDKKTRWPRVKDMPLGGCGTFVRTKVKPTWSEYLATSGSMIRMPRENARGAVDLFEQHHADQLMRPGGGGPNASFWLAFVAQRRREPIVAADDEHCRGTTVVAPAAEAIGERRAVEAFAAFVENDGDGFVGNNVGQRDRFFERAACRCPARGSRESRRPRRREILSDVHSARARFRKRSASSRLGDRPSAGPMAATTSRMKRQLFFFLPFVPAHIFSMS